MFAKITLFTLIIDCEKPNRIELETRPVTDNSNVSSQVSTAGSPLTDMSKLLLTQAQVVAPHLVAQNSSLPNLSSTASVQPSLSRITATSSSGMANVSCTTLPSMINAKLSQHGFQALLREPRACLGNFTQPNCEFRVSFPLLWIKAYPGLSSSTLKGILVETHA